MLVESGVLPRRMTIRDAEMAAHEAEVARLEERKEQVTFHPVRIAVRT